MDPEISRTANDRFKASWGRFLGAGMIGAVAIEVALLIGVPDFSVPVEYRMVVLADTLQSVEWPDPAPAAGPVSQQTRMSPRIRNITVLQLSLPHVYPSLPWEIRLENAVTVKVRIDEEGAVTSVALVEAGMDLGADEAMVELAKMARFSPALMGTDPVAVTGLWRLSVEMPWYRRDREWRR